VPRPAGQATAPLALPTQTQLAVARHEAEHVAEQKRDEQTTRANKPHIRASFPPAGSSTPASVSRELEPELARTCGRALDAPSFRCSPDGASPAPIASPSASALGPWPTGLAKPPTDEDRAAERGAGPQLLERERPQPLQGPELQALHATGAHMHHTARSLGAARCHRRADPVLSSSTSRKPFGQVAEATREPLYLYPQRAIGGPGSSARRAELRHGDLSGCIGRDIGSPGRRSLGCGYKRAWGTPAGAARAALGAAGELVRVWASPLSLPFVVPRRARDGPAGRSPGVPGPAAR